MKLIGLQGYHKLEGQTTDGRRLVTAPGDINSTGIISAMLYPDEDVEWIWTHTPEDSWVSGYRIIKKDLGIGS